MTDSPGLHDELIFAYLDGELNEQQTIEFESLRASNPAIQQRIDALELIHQSLNRIADQSSGSIPINAHQATITSQRKPSVSRSKWIAYAAILAIAASLFIYMNPPAPKKEIKAQRFYTSMTTNFLPDIVCDSPTKFESYTREAFGKTIAADFDTPVQLVGWKYLVADYTPDHLKDASTTRVLVGEMPDGTPLLAIFPSKDFGTPKLEPDSHFYIYTRSINSVKIIEISPLDTPVLLDLMSKK